ncbi:hypothetical protein GCM10022421_06650 [Oceanisphaera sediminis]|uniref:Flagellar hook-length control protein-like C-terminal domain-containing protein n=1 Tax=Oceanisphaera sediminis TaxID=981381 RepID=A0ABP7D9F5_9GAMM
MMILPAAVPGRGTPPGEPRLAANTPGESGFAGVAERLGNLLNEAAGSTRDEPAVSGEAPVNLELPATEADGGEQAALVENSTEPALPETTEAETPDLAATREPEQETTVEAEPADQPVEPVLPELADTPGDEPVTALLQAAASDATQAKTTASVSVEPAAQQWGLRYRSLAESGQTSPSLQPVTGTAVPDASKAEIAAGTPSAVSVNQMLLKQLSGKPGLPALPAIDIKDATVASNSLTATTSVVAVDSARGLAPVVHEWAPLTVSPGNKAALGEQLLQALKDKVELQLNQQVQQARIKLDPPEMGRLELSVRLDGDRLHIQINASQGALRDALTAQADRLRSELLPHHSGGVEVNVGQGDRQSSGSPEPGEQHIGAALADAGEPMKQERYVRDWINALA